MNKRVLSFLFSSMVVVVHAGEPQQAPVIDHSNELLIEEDVPQAVGPMVNPAHQPTNVTQQPQVDAANIVAVEPPKPIAADESKLTQVDALVTAEQQTPVAAQQADTITQTPPIEALVETSTAKVVTAPQFADYPVGTKAFTGKHAIDLTNPVIAAHRKWIMDGMNRKSDFAGDYTLVGWGCGKGCFETYILNRRTGELLSESFGGGEENETPLKTFVDSRMLVTQSKAFDVNNRYVANKFRVYVMDNAKFNLVQILYLRPNEDLERVAGIKFKR